MVSAKLTHMKHENRKRPHWALSALTDFWGIAVTTVAVGAAVWLAAAAFTGFCLVMWDLLHPR